MFRKYQIIAEKCPVCKSSLGMRDPSKYFLAKCDDCNFYYSWGVDDKLPKAINAKDKERKECGCAGCKALGR